MRHDYTKEFREVRSAKMQRAAILGVPSEEQEQIRVVNWLDLHNILFTATANGMKRRKQEVGGKKVSLAAVYQARAGVKAGVPDILIFETNTIVPRRGIAIEMKRSDKTRSSVSPEQRAWLQGLERIGWHTFVAYGADAAIDELVSLGYGCR